MGPLLETIIGISGLVVGVTAPLHVLIRVWRALERIRLLMQGHRATAVVDTYQEYEVGDDRHSFNVTVAFVTKAGQRRVVELPVAVNIRPHIDGRMTVVYRPNDPDYAAALNPVGAVMTVLFAPFILILAATVTPIFASILFHLDIPPMWYLDVFRD